MSHCVFSVRHPTFRQAYFLLYVCIQNRVNVCVSRNFTVELTRPTT